MKQTALPANSQQHYRVSEVLDCQFRFQRKSIKGFHPNMARSQENAATALGNCSWCGINVLFCFYTGKLFKVYFFLGNLRGQSNHFGLKGIWIVWAVQCCAMSDYVIVTLGRMCEADRACRSCSWWWKSGAEDYWELGGVESGLCVSHTHPEGNSGCRDKPCCHDDQTAERYCCHLITQSLSKAVSFNILNYIHLCYSSVLPSLFENCFHSFLISGPVPATSEVLSGDWVQLWLKA